MHVHKLDERTRVSGQIAATDIAMLAGEGIAMIVNNRPDGEEPGQPSSAEMAAAAQASGIAYRHVPVGASGLSAVKVQMMVDALDAANGPVLAFCRSGTRSTYLWALARAQKGEEPKSLIARAHAAGYDLTPIAGSLRQG